MYSYTDNWPRSMDSNLDLSNKVGDVAQLVERQVWHASGAGLTPCESILTALSYGVHTTPVRSHVH